MTAGVDFLQLADGDFGVNGGGLQLLVSEQLLDVTDVRAAFEHLRGAGVPKQMATAFQARHLHSVGGHAREDVGVESVAVAGEEQRRRARVQAKPRTHFFEITFEPCDGARDPGFPTEHVLNCAHSSFTLSGSELTFSGQRQRSFDFCR